tara:strand:+ start:182 stop:352 length:171 start_codon:yes stop_codon:yes gene_type:complete
MDNKYYSSKFSPYNLLREFTGFYLESSNNYCLKVKRLSPPPERAFKTLRRSIEVRR